MKSKNKKIKIKPSRYRTPLASDVGEKSGIYFAVPFHSDIKEAKDWVNVNERKQKK